MSHPLISLEAGALDRIAGLLPPAHQYVIIADDRVAPIYGERLHRLVARSQLVTFPAGEANKTRATWQQLTDRMLELPVSRDACVIAVGGGVTTDLAGFVAATYMRGLPIVQVPTSLLAMIDAAIGGKTGVDVPEGKNLVGAFHLPHAVVIDPVVLNTLPDSELSNGLAEAIKHGVIADRAYLEWIGESASAIFARRAHTLESLIRRSIEIKSQFVDDDLREAGKRAALNFGHTIGHALERLSNYDLMHGQAVGLGMMIESEIGTALGVTHARTTAEIAAALHRARLPDSIEFDDATPLIEATSTDKKARGGSVRYVLLGEVGSVARTATGEWTWEVPDDVVRNGLRQFAV